jgi:hypothetical protein
LSILTPYLALAIFPVAFLLGSFFNPPRLLWGIRLALENRPFEPISHAPAQVREKASAYGRYSLFLVDAIIVGLVLLFTRRYSVHAAMLGLHVLNWEFYISVGVASALLLNALRRLGVTWLPIDPEDSFTQNVRAGSLRLWVCIFIVGAFSEELWLALCLVVLKASGHSPAISVVLALLVFAFMHRSYGWGAISASLVECISALLFLHYGSLFVTFFYHFVANCGSLYLHRLWRR